MGPTVNTRVETVDIKTVTVKLENVLMDVSLDGETLNVMKVRHVARNWVMKNIYGLNASQLFERYNFGTVFNLNFKKSNAFNVYCFDSKNKMYYVECFKRSIVQNKNYKYHFLYGRTYCSVMSKPCWVLCLVLKTICIVILRHVSCNIE